ncbi:hypothetical protein Tco_1172263, partial [Tanacetum coccineum]
GRDEHEPEFDFDAVNIPVTTTGAEISTGSPKVKTDGYFIKDIAAKTLVNIRRSATKAKDKGKAKMEESESAMTKTKRQQEQERLGFIVAVRLQAEFNKEERQRISRAEDDLNTRRGIISGRVASLPRSTKIQPCVAQIQGRKITEIDQDPSISLVQHDAEIHGSHEHEPEFDFDATNIPVTTTGVEISTASPEVKIVSDSIEDIAAETLVYIRRSAAKPKDKVAVRLQAELDKEERQRISRAEGLKTAGYKVATAGEQVNAVRHNLMLID